jgi:lipoyl(octanoyl) transferase
VGDPDGWYNHGMPATPSGPTPPRSLATWLAGRIEWPAYARLAERLAWDVSEPDGRGPTLVLCELEPCITIGRQGSRADVLFTDEELAQRRLPLRFVGRGGGAVLHGSGQVFVALFARLEDLQLGRHDVGGYLSRFETAIATALRGMRCGPVLRVPGVGGIRGRSGLLAATGVAVRRGVVWHGGFVNVCPQPGPFLRVRTAAAASGAAPAAVASTMGSVESDLRRRVRLQDFRTAVARSLAEVFACDRSHIHAGFPFAVPGPRSPETITRVG